MPVKPAHSWLIPFTVACGLLAPLTAHSARHPFPQHLDYGPDSILPNQYPREWMDDDVRDFYDYWKQEYVVSAGADTTGNPMSRIAFGHHSEVDENSNPLYPITVSEGQGYGMLITALMAGHDPDAQPRFDALLRFAERHPSHIDHHLMGWCVPKNNPVCQSEDDPQAETDSAFDGDADIAYALLLADRQWGSQGAIDYASMARTRIQAIMASTIGPNSRLPLLGDWVDPSGPIYNQYTQRTSDFMPETFRAFQQFTGNSAWRQVLDTTRATAFWLQRHFSRSAGLFPDFVVPRSPRNHKPKPAPSNFLEASTDGQYAYNAARVPLRFGLDALLNGNAASRHIARTISAWARNHHADPSHIVDGYNLNGYPLPDRGFSSAFVAPLGVAAMTDPAHQDWLNQLYDRVNQEHENYYEDSLDLLSLLAMTGNFWRPYSFEDTSTGGNDTTVYEDAEDASTARWKVSDATPAGATVSIQFDPQRASRVIALRGAGKKNAFLIGGNAGNPGAWNDTNHRILSWQSRFARGFTLYVSVETDRGRRFLTYLPLARDIGRRGRYILIGLDHSIKDDHWHRLQRNLESDLSRYDPGNRIISVNGLFIRGNGLVDDITLSSDDVGPDWYRPGTRLSWQIQLQEAVNPAYPAQLYDVDLFDSSGAFISRLKADGKKVICYFSAGSYENWRSDADRFDASVLGRPLDAWPGERWLDIRSRDVRKIMTHRLDLAVEKGCDGVDPDNVDGYINTPGFTFDDDDQLDYNRFIAREAHRRKLAVGLKNDLDQIPELVGHFDFAVNEQCFQYDECNLLTPFIQQGKPVFNIEYQARLINDAAARRELCSRANRKHFSTLLLPLDLDDSFRFACQDLARIQR